MHTKHNLSLQPISQNYNLVSHTTYVGCVLFFIHARRDEQFRVATERQIFEKFFMPILFTLIFFIRYLLRGNRRANIYFIFRLVRDAWRKVWTEDLCLISQRSIYLTTAPSITRITNSNYLIGSTLFCTVCA